MDEQSYCRRCIVGLSVWLVSITININKRVSRAELKLWLNFRALTPFGQYNFYTGMVNNPKSHAFAGHVIKQLSQKSAFLNLHT